MYHSGILTEVLVIYLDKTDHFIVVGFDRKLIRRTILLHKLQKLFSTQACDTGHQISCISTVDYCRLIILLNNVLQFAGIYTLPTK